MTDCASWPLREASASNAESLMRLKLRLARCEPPAKRLEGFREENGAGGCAPASGKDDFNEGPDPTLPVESRLANGNADNVGPPEDVADHVEGAKLKQGERAEAEGKSGGLRSYLDATNADVVLGLPDSWVPSGIEDASERIERNRLIGDGQIDIDEGTTANTNIPEESSEGRRETNWDRRGRELGKRNEGVEMRSAPGGADIEASEGEEEGLRVLLAQAEKGDRGEIRSQEGTPEGGEGGEVKEGASKEAAGGERDGREVGEDHEDELGGQIFEGTPNWERMKRREEGMRRREGWKRSWACRGKGREGRGA